MGEKPRVCHSALLKMWGSWGRKMRRRDSVVGGGVVVVVVVVGGAVAMILSEKGGRVFAGWEVRR